MISRKNIFSIICIGIIAIQIPVFADDISDMKASIADTITKLIQKYELQIQTLETENSALKKELLSLKGTGVIITIGTGSMSNIISTATPTTITPASSQSDIYNVVIKQANDTIGTILSENNLPAYTAIGLFEFIQPNAVFLSLDDGANPPGVTAFKTKIAYTFDSNLVFTKVGLFDLDYASQRYRTLFGSNPYTKSVRTRIKNPTYKGKLLEPMVSNTPVSTTAISEISNTLATTEVTLAQIKTAYTNTKLLNALKLSDSYIIKNPNDIDVLRIRYRSYYIVGKYDDSLAEIKKMETIQGTNFERTVACDAAVIGKIAKKLDVSTYYSAICKKK